MIGIFLQLILLIIIPLLLIRPAMGVSLFLICFFLIPSLSLPFIGLEEVETIVLFAFVFMMANIKNIKRIKEIDYSPFIPFIVLYLTLFLLTFLSTQLVPLDFSIKNYVRYVLMTFIIPICIYTLIICRPTILKSANAAMIFVVFVSIGYGLILTFFHGSNPYLDMLSKEINLPEIHLGDDSDRLFGAISSVFMHPMSFGIMIGLSCIYLLTLNKYKAMDGKIFVMLFVMTLLASVLCGVRSSLVALMGTGAVYLLLKRRFKLFLAGGIMVFIALLIISNIPALSSYIGSIFQMDSDDVHGSSIAQRLIQLAASVEETQGNLLFGNGYAWHSYYIWDNDGYGHPLLHGWESLLFVAITDSGFIGVFLWIVFCFYFAFKFKDIGLICLFAYFMIYRLATGTFGEEMFYIFYTLVLCTKKSKQK